MADTHNKGALVRRPIPGFESYEVESNGTLWQKYPGGFRKARPSGGSYTLKQDVRVGAERSVRALRGTGAALAKMAGWEEKAAEEPKPAGRGKNKPAAAEG